MSKKGKTIAEVVRNNLCTGCGTCVSLCPRSAIGIVKDDSKGIYIPLINNPECNQCGICLNICPGHQLDFKKLNKEIFGKDSESFLLGNYLNCYLGYANDYEIRYNCSSGGLVTSLLIFALEEGIIDGALVTRMKKDNPLEPEPFIARTKEEIISAAKSKYCPVPANISLKEILEKEGKYAVVGLPCHLHGIRKAEMINRKLREKIILHIGIFCVNTKTFLGTEFQLRRMGVEKEEVVEINYRGEGWPGSMSVKCKNGNKKFSALLRDYYDNKFRSFTPWRCTVCIDHSAELADISFGDAWLDDIKKSDKIGTSVIVSRSKQGEDILRMAANKGKIVLTHISNEEIIRSQGEFNWKKRDINARFKLSKFLNKKVPVYNVKLASSSLWAYFRGILLYSRSFLASRRCFWWVLDIYCSVFSFGSRLKSKIMF